MADTSSSTDGLASAKANFRDTIKWLATTFAALAAAVIAGSSVSGISTLGGLRLCLALLGGAIGLVCILLAIGTLLQLLTADIYFASQLEKNPEMMRELGEYAKDIIPPECSDLWKFFELRNGAIATIQDNNRNVNDREAASKFLASLNESLARLTSLAQFYGMVHHFTSVKQRLFWYAILVIVGLGTFAVCSGKTSDGHETSDRDAPPHLVLLPGDHWSTISKALADACGSGPLGVEILNTSLSSGWVKFRLAGPSPCAGVELTLPSAFAPAMQPR